MRRAVVVLGTTAAGLAALFSYKTHLAGIAVASTSQITPTMTAAPMTAPAANPSASATPSKSAAKKSTPKPSSSAAAPRRTTATTPTATRSTTPSKKAVSPATTAPSSSAPAGKSGTFTGPSESTQYGNVQVQITVSNGKITNASGSLPQGGDSIAQNALPQLNQEALTAQSANIQAVSGATYTSQGYIGSLQQAVNEAGL
jgi:uncharacterized protein with FMN-binding domain